jgi:hypothetical protein
VQPISTWIAEATRGRQPRLARYDASRSVRAVLRTIGETPSHV